ncbi:erg26, C-3 sterol dehydrogenase [Rhodotorula kratochvilovae]
MPLAAAHTVPAPAPAPESYAVIGGEGFVGGALVSALLASHGPARVASFGLTQRRFDEGYRFFRTDITSPASVLAALQGSGATTVFHTASPHARATPEVWREVNVGGTEAVVKACREAGVRKLVFTSSMTVVYEEGVALKNVDERMPRIETEEKEATYAGTKAKAEEIVLAANGQDGLLTCALRLGGIIGPGDRQVLPGWIAVHKAGQSIFQMGDNLNLFDFVTLKNVVHAHLLAAEKLDAPPISPAVLEARLPPVAATVGRRALPTSNHPEPVDPLHPPPNDELPLPAARNRWNQFYDLTSPSNTSLSVAGQAFTITNGEPVALWSLGRAIWHAYDPRPPRWWAPLVFPSSVGMLFATVCEWAGAVQGKRPEECGVNRAYMAYVLKDMYFDIERARRLLGYEPIESLEEGIRSGVEWYKADEERQRLRAREQPKSK